MKHFRKKKNPKKDGLFSNIRPKLLSRSGEMNSPKQQKNTWLEMVQRFFPTTSSPPFSSIIMFKGHYHRTYTRTVQEQPPCVGINASSSLVFLNTRSLHPKIPSQPPSDRESYVGNHHEGELHGHPAPPVLASSDSCTGDLRRHLACRDVHRRLAGASDERIPRLPGMP